MALSLGGKDCRNKKITSTQVERNTSGCVVTNRTLKTSHNRRAVSGAGGAEPQRMFHVFCSTKARAVVPDGKYRNIVL